MGSTPSGGVEHATWRGLHHREVLRGFALIYGREIDRAGRAEERERERGFQYVFRSNALFISLRRVLIMNPRDT